MFLTRTLRRLPLVSLCQSLRSRGPRMSTFAQSLLDLKAKYLDDVRDGKGGEWTVVMGNEAGDLDSMASAIAYSWLLNTSSPTSSIALTQAQRTDLHLRPENIFALSKASLSESHLLCFDEIPSYNPSSPATSPFPSNRFALVDHNRLLPHFSSNNPSAKVVAVVDHHDDEGLYQDTADTRIITVPTGSCTSLVANLINHSTSEATIPPELATLLLCGILIDTNGLKPKGKAEKADHEAASFLFPRSTLAAGSVSDFAYVSASESLQREVIDSLASTLQTRKSNISHLSVFDLLRRDYKEYTWMYSPPPQSLSSSSPPPVKQQQLQVGLSTVPISLTHWCDSQKMTTQFWKDTVTWMSDRSLNILGVLTTYRTKRKQKHKRQIMLIISESSFSPSSSSPSTSPSRLSSPKDDTPTLKSNQNREEYIRQILMKLYVGLEIQGEELKLERKVGMEESFGIIMGKRGDFGLFVRVWKQKDASKTRKAIAPCLKRVIEETGESMMEEQGKL